MSRRQADQLHGLCRRATDAHGATAASYARWRFARLRDGIHATLRWTADVEGAIWQLEHSAGREAAGAGWVYATCHLAGLQRSLIWWIETLEASMTLGREYRALRGDEQDDYGTPAGDLMARYRGSLWWIGGMPSPDSVGRSADMLMAANADQVLTAAEQQLALMTGHHAYRTWQRLYPEEAGCSPHHHRNHHPRRSRGSTPSPRNEGTVTHRAGGRSRRETAAVASAISSAPGGSKGFQPQRPNVMSMSTGTAAEPYRFLKNRTGKKGQRYLPGCCGDRGH